MEAFQKGSEHVPRSCLMDRRAHAAVARSLRNSTLNNADTTSAHALSQERRGGARTAMQNLTDILAKQFLVCAEKALAEGAKHHWS